MTGGPPPGPPASRPSFPRRTLAWIRSHKFATALIVVASLVLAECATIPWFGIGDLRTENPSETALMRQRVREAETEGKPLTITQKWIPLARLPRHVVDAVVVAEDGTFFTHGGVDWFEVQESIEKNIKERKAARGGSTITQQLAKNLYLSTSKDPIRKVKELAITLLMESKLDKNRILEIYLNVIEWGRGIFGIEAASRAYFGKSAAGLTLAEATRLAAVIPSPLKHRPDQESRYVLRRMGIVLHRMEARNMAGRESTGPADSTTLPDSAEVTETAVDTTEEYGGEENGL